MENIIVGAIVGLAAIWSGLRLLRRRRTTGCGSGCAGCASAGAPQSLIQIRRGRAV